MENRSENRRIDRFYSKYDFKFETKNHPMFFYYELENIYFYLD